MIRARQFIDGLPGDAGLQVDASMTGVSGSPGRDASAEERR
jgi:hypothetical protein